MRYSNFLKPELRRIYQTDNMHLGTEDEYFRAGHQAIELIKDSINRISPKKIVDFPSGYGRITRWLRNEWAEAEIHAVETDKDALHFVNQEYQAMPILANKDFSFQLPSKQI